MARNDTVEQNTIEQNGRKKFIQKIAFTTTAGITPLLTKDVYGTTLPDTYTLVLQPVGADCYYELRETGGTTAITSSAGARPGVYVSALQQEFTVPHDNNAWLPGKDARIDVVGVGSGTLLVFWVT